MAGEDRESKRGLGGRQEDARGPSPADPVGPTEQPRPLELPRQSPLYHAEHADRYARQELIVEYQERFGCRLIVVKDVFPNSIVLLEELLYDADAGAPLHLMLDSPGGDGETAVRMVRSAQDRTTELTVIVPNQAKSAATILAMGAQHRILMGPTSDLGPVDPKFQFSDGRLWSAKDIIAAVEAAENAIATNPDTYPLHATLLSQVDALLVQRARSALERTEDVVAEALRSNPERSEHRVQELKEQVKVPLIDLPKDHGAVFGVEDAARAGLPVERIDHRSDQWKLIWRLYTKYALLPPEVRAYEGERASRIVYPSR